MSEFHNPLRALKKRGLIAGLILTASLGVLGISGMLPTVVPAAAAQSLSAKSIVDQAIRDGLVGETASGYLALVKGSASADITNAMNEVNIGRKTVYTRLARAQNVSIDVVAALTGEKQIAKAAPGSYVQDISGVWRRI